MHCIVYTYRVHSTPKGRPLTCSGQAPIVKLGAGWLVGDIVNDAEPGGEVELTKLDALFGDLIGVIGDLTPLPALLALPAFNPKKLHSSISHVLQSMPLTVGWSGQPSGCCSSSCCCCCNVDSNDGVLRSLRSKPNDCCCCRRKSPSNLLLLLTVAAAAAAASELLQLSGVGVLAARLLFADDCGDCNTCVVFDEPSL